MATSTVNLTVFTTAITLQQSAELNALADQDLTTCNGTYFDNTSRRLTRAEFELLITAGVDCSSSVNPGVHVYLQGLASNSLPPDKPDGTAEFIAPHYVVATISFGVTSAEQVGTSNAFELKPTQYRAVIFNSLGNALPANNLNQLNIRAFSEEIVTP
jgi:hypothetical protein